MRLKPVLLDLVLLGMVIPIVILLFKYMPTKQDAALVAGFLFVGVPGFLIYWRLKHPLEKPFAKMAWWSGVLVFWLGFAWPILLVRLLNWNVDFAELKVFGFSAVYWHHLANSYFTVMLAAIAVAGVATTGFSRK